MKVQKGTALWRGVVGAIVGAVVMLCLMMVLGQFSLPYLLAGPFYGFGLTFANWHVVMEKTKQGAVQGASGLAIGLILSHWLKDHRFGMWGWLFFLFRVSWHLGFCWIPGIWYGIQAIREEAQAPAPVAASPSNVDWEARQLDQQRIARAAAAQAAARAAASAPRPAPASQPTPASRPAPAPQSAPVSAPGQTSHSLTCAAGAFAGASFPVSPGEVLSLGSDPTSCQIVLPQTCAATRHCSVLYNLNRGCWQVKDLSGGQTFINGIQPVTADRFQELPQGAVLCIGQGKNSQRFQLQ